MEMYDEKQCNCSECKRVQQLKIPIVSRSRNKAILMKGFIGQKEYLLDTSDTIPVIVGTNNMIPDISGFASYLRFSYLYVPQDWNMEIHNSFQEQIES